MTGSSDDELAVFIILMFIIHPAECWKEGRETPSPEAELTLGLITTTVVNEVESLLKELRTPGSWKHD